ncbi:hypothetical protein TL16_g06723 [Triparma laevis f. inornata]|uniref:Methyltransferase FkbM domain-containing protein n=1 Tax=Triparma laevis f. inornata TaxID=1714386 RepID=A0A9W7AWR3_9STRA|nr:hypothetical protein TL16_g06723 [Triparma laevis f. inornata]
MRGQLVAWLLGFDAIKFYALWSLPLLPVPNVDVWWHLLKTIKNMNCGACFQCSGQPSAASSNTFRGKQKEEVPPPLVLCVEPLPINVKVLKEGYTHLKYDENFPTFEILDLAGSDHADDTVYLPDTNRVGAENLGITDEVTNTKVQTTTVDAIFEEYQLKEIDVLSIDTEGYDPLVLSGASETLKQRKARYVEFEFHIHGPWKTTSLSSVIEELDGYGYDCFWAGGEKLRGDISVSGKGGGMLWPVTGPMNWDTRYDEVRAWSNIACVDRLDQWAAVLEEFVYDPLI